MYGFLAGLSSPESIFAEKYLIPVLSPKQEMSFFLSKIALFHINCYFIGKVSPCSAFWSVLVLRNPFLLEKILISCFVTKTGNMSFFLSKIALFHINCYFIGKVSPCTAFWSVLVLRNPFLLEKILISCFVTKTGNMSFFLSKIALFHNNCYFIGKVSPMYGFLAGFSSPESILLKNYLSPVMSPLFKKQEICQFFPKLHYFTQLLLHR